MANDLSWWINYLLASHKEGASLTLTHDRRCELIGLLGRTENELLALELAPFGETLPSMTVPEVYLQALLDVEVAARELSGDAAYCAGDYDATDATKRDALRDALANMHGARLLVVSDRLAKAQS